jgi:2-polyprenyl-6-hydroxyphenyl methylase/3-demethylubiquinone-9 3-methyltransferase
MRSTRCGWPTSSALVGGLDGKRVLDVGCGGGILTEAMAAKGAQVTGIDLADKPLKVAMLHRLESGSPVEYRNVAVEAIAAESPSSLRRGHVHGDARARARSASVVSACAKLAKPGGG